MMILTKNFNMDFEQVRFIPGQHSVLPQTNFERISRRLRQGFSFASTCIYKGHIFIVLSAIQGLFIQIQGESGSQQGHHHRWQRQRKRRPRQRAPVVSHRQRTTKDTSETQAGRGVQRQLFRTGIRKQRSQR